MIPNFLIYYARYRSFLELAPAGTTGIDSVPSWVCPHRPLSPPSSRLQALTRILREFAPWWSACILPYSCKNYDKSVNKIVTFFLSFSFFSATVVSTSVSFHFYEKSSIQGLSLANFFGGLWSRDLGKDADWLNFLIFW